MSSNSKAVLLLPGGGMSSWLWSRIVDKLDADPVCPEYRLPVNALEARLNSTVKDCVDYFLSLISEYGSVTVVGQSAVGALSLPLRIMNTAAIKSQVKRKSTPMSKKASIVKKYFCNTCDEETADFILKQELLSDPLCVAFEKANWEDLPEIRQKYVVLTKDNTHPVKKQLAIAGNMNISDLEYVEADHMAALSKPEEIANIINKW